MNHDIERDITDASGFGTEGQEAAIIKVIGVGGGVKPFVLVGTMVDD